MIDDVQHHYAIGMVLKMSYGWVLLADIGENKVVAVSPYSNRFNNPFIVLDPLKITYEEMCHIYEMSNEHDISALKLNYKFDDNKYITHNVYDSTLLKLGNVIITKDGTCGLLAQVDYGRACIITLCGTVLAPSVPITNNPNISQDEYCMMGGSLDDYCIGEASRVLI